MDCAQPCCRFSQAARCRPIFPFACRCPIRLPHLPQQAAATTKLQQGWSTPRTSSKKCRGRPWTARRPAAAFSQAARCRPIFRLRAGVQSDSPTFRSRLRPPQSSSRAGALQGLRQKNVARRPWTARSPAAAFRRQPAAVQFPFACRLPNPTHPPSAAGCGHHKAPAGLEHSKDFVKKMSRGDLGLRAALLPLFAGSPLPSNFPFACRCPIRLPHLPQQAAATTKLQQGWSTPRTSPKKMSRATLDCAQPCCRFLAGSPLPSNFPFACRLPNPTHPPSAAGCGHHKAPAGLEHSKDFVYSPSLRAISS